MSSAVRAAWKLRYNEGLWMLYVVLATLFFPHLLSSIGANAGAVAAEQRESWVTPRRLSKSLAKHVAAEPGPSQYASRQHPISGVECSECKYEVVLLTRESKKCPARMLKLQPEVTAVRRAITNHTKSKNVRVGVVAATLQWPGKSGVAATNSDDGMLMCARVVKPLVEPENASQRHDGRSNCPSGTSTKLCNGSLPRRSGNGVWLGGVGTVNELLLRAADPRIGWSRSRWEHSGFSDSCKTIRVVVVLVDPEKWSDSKVTAQVRSNPSEEISSRRLHQRPHDGKGVSDHPSSNNLIEAEPMDGARSTAAPLSATSARRLLAKSRPISLADKTANESRTHLSKRLRQATEAGTDPLVQRMFVQLPRVDTNPSPTKSPPKRRKRRSKAAPVSQRRFRRTVGNKVRRKVKHTRNELDQRKNTASSKQWESVQLFPQIERSGNITWARRQTITNSAILSRSRRKLYPLRRGAPPIYEPQSQPHWIPPSHLWDSRPQTLWTSNPPSAWSDDPESSWSNDPFSPWTTNNPDEMWNNHITPQTSRWAASNYRQPRWSSNPSHPSHPWANVQQGSWNSPHSPWNNHYNNPQPPWRNSIEPAAIRWQWSPVPERANILSSQECVHHPDPFMFEGYVERNPYAPTILVLPQEDALLPENGADEAADLATDDISEEVAQKREHPQHSEALDPPVVEDLIEEPLVERLASLHCYPQDQWVDSVLEALDTLTLSCS